MSWERFGSPYDPNYRGKMPRPDPNKAEGKNRREQRFLCPVCGDPNCPQSHEGWVQGSPPTTEVRFSSSTRSSIEELHRLMAERLYLGMDMSFARGADAQPKSGPPASYKAARKQVEKWLIKAPEQTFDDVVGNDEALEQLRDAIEAPVKHKQVYDAYGMKMPKGALLSGPPGCGKTMFARAAASELRRLYKDATEFVSISGSELQSPFIGVTEGHIKAIFAFAREYRAYHGRPLLVFMDEAEVLLPDRTGRVRRVAPWEESQVATFLAEMDGMQESGAFVLLATNRPEVIDQAVLRDGRCEFKIIVRRPTPEALEIILRKNFAGILSAEPDVETLVFAAVEMLRDPNKIIAEAHTIQIDAEFKGLELQGVEVKELSRKHFLLENIVSGAMAASVPARAKRHAFARDKKTGVAKGVTTADVIAAVNDLFEENKGLEHSFALAEFKQELLADLRALVRDREKGGAK